MLLLYVDAYRFYAGSELVRSGGFLRLRPKIPLSRPISRDIKHATLFNVCPIIPNLLLPVNLL